MFLNKANLWYNNGKEKGDGMELTSAQIKDFAGSEDIYNEAKKIVEEQRIVSLDIDDFSSQELIFINATIKDEKQYHEVNMSIDKDDVVVRAHLCNCHQHQVQVTCAHCCAVLIRVKQDQDALHSQEESTTSLIVQDPYAVQLMNAYEEDIVYSSLAMNLKQSIHIEPVLELRKQKIMALTL